MRLLDSPTLLFCLYCLALALMGLAPFVAERMVLR